MGRKHTAIRMQPELYAQLERIAHQDDRSVNYVMVQALELFVEARR